MRLNYVDGNGLAVRIVQGSASKQDVRTAIELNREMFRSRVTTTLHDAHILATYTTAKTRLWDYQAQEGHMQTALAMQDPDGSIYDFDDDGNPVRFKTWRELVKIENDSMWGNP